MKNIMKDKQGRLILLGLLVMMSIGGFRTLRAEGTQGPSETPEVASKIETDPVRNGDDAADDPAIWVHPTDPAKSTILGTDKRGGLSVYDLSGREIQWREDGRINNVAVRYDFPLNGESIDIVTAANQSERTIWVYRVDPTDGHLHPISIIPTHEEMQVYGLCMYRSSASGKYFVFVTESPYSADKDVGRVQQYELYATAQGTVDGTLVRSFNVGSEAEGCVADDELGHAYFAETQAGKLWKYGAEPGDGDQRTLIDSTDSGRLEEQLEGVTLYYASNGTGYLIVADQRNHYFVVYRREGNNDFVMTFTVGEGDGIDPVSGTDGIDVINVPLDQNFPKGVFVAHDSHNTVGDTSEKDSGSNYKLVPWESIASAVEPPLTIDPTWNPRQTTAAPPTASPAATLTLTPTPTPTPTLTPTPLLPDPPEPGEPDPSATPSPTMSPTPTSTPHSQPPAGTPTPAAPNSLWLPIITDR